MEHYFKIANKLCERLQDFQGTFRSVGVLAAMVGRGDFLSLQATLWFLLAAVALVGATITFLARVRDQLGREGGGPDRRTLATGWNVDC